MALRKAPFQRQPSWGSKPRARPRPRLYPPRCALALCAVPAALHTQKRPPLFFQEHLLSPAHSRALAPGTPLSFGTCCSLCLDHPSQYHFPGKLAPVLKVSCESWAKTHFLPKTCCQGPWAGRRGDAFHTVGMWFLPLVSSTGPSSHFTGLLGDGRERAGSGHRCLKPGPL